MNIERIEELYYQSCVFDLETGYFIRNDKEKFAQLIILECAGVNFNSTFKDGEFHAREVLEHFGVAG